MNLLHNFHAKYAQKLRAAWRALGESSKLPTWPKAYATIRQPGSTVRAAIGAQPANQRPPRWLPAMSLGDILKNNCRKVKLGAVTAKGRKEGRTALPSLHGTPRTHSRTHARADRTSIQGWTVTRWPPARTATTTDISRLMTIVPPSTPKSDATLNISSGRPACHLASRRPRPLLFK